MCDNASSPLNMSDNSSISVNGAFCQRVQARIAGHLSLHGLRYGKPLGLAAAKDWFGGFGEKIWP
jgi:hypothetical protein